MPGIIRKHGYDGIFLRVYLDINFNMKYEIKGDGYRVSTYESSY